MIKDGTVVNVSLWDGDTFKWQPPSDMLCIPAPDHVGIGWTYEDGEWTAPVVPEPEITDEVVDETTEG
jgi:hypothetical protein